MQVKELNPKNGHTYMGIEVGDCFKCDDILYVIVQGYITHYAVAGTDYFQKSSHLKVQQLEWEFNSTDIKPINDFKNREYFMLDKYVLKPVGNSHKFITIRKQFTIEPFELNKAVWLVAWTNEKERESNKTNKKFSRK
jgi:hypothetical protein